MGMRDDCFLNSAVGKLLRFRNNILLLGLGQLLALMISLPCKFQSFGLEIDEVPVYS